MTVIPAFERLCHLAERQGLKVGVDVGEFNRAKERRPLSTLLVIRPPKGVVMQTEIGAPDSVGSLARACARLAGMIETGGVR